MTSALVRKLASFVLVPAAVVFLAGCSDPGGPQPLPRAVEIKPTRAVFPVEVVNGRKRVVVTARIKNDSDRTIYYAYCSEAISKFDDASWETVWRPICLLALIAPEPIAPGASKELQVQVDEHAGSPDIRFPFEEAGANYRVDIRLLLKSRKPGSDEFLPIKPAESVSETFQVVE